MTPLDLAYDRATRLDGLLTGLERTLGEDRIGSPETDRAIRRLLDVAREETAALCKILDGDAP